MREKARSGAQNGGVAGCVVARGKPKASGGQGCGIQVYRRGFVRAKGK